MHSTNHYLVTAIIAISAAACAPAPAPAPAAAQACPACETPPPLVAGTYTVCSIEWNESDDQPAHFSEQDTIAIGDVGSGKSAGLRNVSLSRKGVSFGEFWGIPQADGLLAGTVPLLGRDNRTAEPHLVLIAQTPKVADKCPTGVPSIAIDVCRLVDAGTGFYCRGDKGSHAGHIHATF
jgi:hypothetical protein